MNWIIEPRKSDNGCDVPVDFCPVLLGLIWKIIKEAGKGIIICDQIIGFCNHLCPIETLPVK